MMECMPKAGEVVAEIYASGLGARNCPSRGVSRVGSRTISGPAQLPSELAPSMLNGTTTVLPTIRLSARCCSGHSSVSLGWAIRLAVSPFCGEQAIMGRGCRGSSRMPVSLREPHPNYLQSHMQTIVVVAGHMGRECMAARKQQVITDLFGAVARCVASMVVVRPWVVSTGREPEGAQGPS